MSAYSFLPADTIGAKRGNLLKTFAADRNMLGKPICGKPNLYTPTAIPW